MLEKIVYNKEQVEEKQSLELARQLTEDKNNCPCRRTKCTRHGNCEECIAHHNENETKYKPYCMRKSNKKSKSKSL